MKRPRDEDVELHQEVRLDIHERPRIPWHVIIHPNVSVIVTCVLCTIGVITWSTWAIVHHQDFFDTSTLVVKVGLLLISAFLANKMVIQPLVETYHRFIHAHGQWKRNRVLVARDTYTFIDEEFHQVTQDRNTYNWKGEIAPSQENKALPLAKPTIADMVAAIDRNSYTIGLGRSLTTGQPLIADLDEAHIKLIGGTRMGKSCEAAAIIESACQTHDPERLQIALLDMENKTSRLFADDPHVLTLKTAHNAVKIYARNIPEVATHLGFLLQLMDWRYTLTDAQLVRQAHILVYMEEFLDWKKRLRQFVSPQQRDKALSDFSSLATRGIKAKIHLMACAQVDYADEELRDAMAQFLGINLSFAVKPTAAQAAGFVNADLLKQNYEARTPGQFVIEMIGGADLGVAPDFDVKQRLARLRGMGGETESLDVVDADVATIEDLPLNVRTFPQAQLVQPVEPTEATSDERLKRLSESEVQQFIAAYKACGNVDKSLAAIARGTSYRDHARELVRVHNLRRES